VTEKRLTAGTAPLGIVPEAPAHPEALHTERLDDDVRRSVLSDGTIVLSERMDSVRSAAAGLWVRAGTAHERPERRGVSHLLEHLVFKGTRRLSAREIAATVEGTGGSLDAYTTHEHTAFHARVPADHLSTGLAVLAELAFEPALRSADLEIERGVVLEEIARVEDTPDDLVFELQSEFLYGTHPYGAPILGTPDTIRAIELEDLIALHRGAYRPANMVVVVAGLVDHEQLVDQVLRLWPASGDTVPLPAVEPVRFAGRGHRIVERPGGRQVHIVAGFPAVEYGHRLRHASLLVGQALGGGMSSRLFQEIRERLGLAYSVFSFQTFYGRGGHAGAYLGTGAESAHRRRGSRLRRRRNEGDRR